jgi:uncharacterized protein
VFLAMPVFNPTKVGVSVTVRVTARAGTTEIVGVRDDVLLVKLAAAPVEGAANDALIALLADTFDLPKRQVEIASGNRSRIKHVKLVGAATRGLDERLAAASKR